MTALTDEVRDICADLGIQTISVRPRMNAFAQLRSQINLIHSDLTMRGIQSQAVADATYAIETLTRAYMEPTTPIDWRLEYNLTKTERRIAEILYKRIGTSVHWDAILQSIYADRPRAYEELLDPMKVMQVLVCKMRKQFKNSPFSIETDYGVGYRMVLKPSALALTALQELQAH